MAYHPDGSRSATATPQPSKLDLPTSMPRLRSQRTWFQRLNWNPLVVAFPLGFFVYRSATAGLTTMRTIGLCVLILWFGMAVFDWMTRRCPADWIYGDRDDPRPPSDA